jgi:hypothetical protein
MPKSSTISTRLRAALAGLLIAGAALAATAPAASADSWDGKWYAIQTQYVKPESSPLPQVVTNWNAENEQSVLRDFGDYANQKWAFVHVSAAPGWFHAVNGWSGKCLTIEGWDAWPGRRVTQQTCQTSAVAAGGQLWHEEGHPEYPQPQLSKAIRNKNGLYLAIDSNHGWCPYNCTNHPLIGDEEGQSWDLFYLRHLN